jgi:hypothetical protein
MSALDVISIQQAKDWLQIDQSYVLADAEIEACIVAAVDWVERKTDYKLYARNEVFTSNGCEIITYSYPVNDVTAEEGSVAVSVGVYTSSAKTVISASKGVKVTVNVGYANVNEIPQSLVMAVRKLITYFNENRDMYALEIPNDVQMLINPYRRSVGIA